MRLTLDLNFAPYAAIARTPRRQALMAEALAGFTADPAVFDDGAPSAGAGLEAMRATLVPPIALGFSLFFGLLHLTKFSLFSVQLITMRAAWLRRLIVIGGISFGGGLLLLIPNQMTDSPLYRYLEAQTATAMGWPFAASLTWVINAQPYFHPANEWIRRHLLFGDSFGYHE
jgi:hypothetical protein